MANKTEFHAGTPVKIAIMAMGGQGGGVLADWVVDVAEQDGWWAQTTSVPGVAQRTGATIYYVELMPGAAVKAAGRAPALAMMPTPGDVDIVVAAELMEAGRAIQRGLVTPDRTTLISSSHRAYSVNEKTMPGNGISDSNKIIEVGNQASKRFICANLQELADKAGSVISASLFGALAGSGALPFTREGFEETIRRGGIGVNASLKAFALGFESAASAPAAANQIADDDHLPTVPERAASPKVQALLDDLKNNFPVESQPMLLAGLRRTLDFQDVRYAKEYLAHMHAIHTLDSQFGGITKSWALTTAAARYVAVAMAYDDVIRTADLKTRGSRADRVLGELSADASQVVYTTEYMHPQIEEICGVMPAAMGQWIMNSKRISKFISIFCRKGRFVQSNKLSGFFLLYILASLRPIRRITLRHKVEAECLTQWLQLIDDTAHKDYDLAVEIVNCRRLVKGYSDTHVRGMGKYQRLLREAAKLPGQANAATRLRILREAALADPHGKQLDLLIKQTSQPAAT
ncbi:MAG: indolepyruvate oxidoreductase subunit beta family protein [Burkholderiaceae bacterium]|nr:MAG: indolepyruvate oxidoreductase subunit beta family protein [Burkholderiaceae bacterium]TAM06878.1 MAG: indolepyruvate oxidoreductase subunit beta family protein [Pusillimonas sp.]